jgi:nitrous oxidase accessory protein NosD
MLAVLLAGGLVWAVTGGESTPRADRTAAPSPSVPASPSAPVATAVPATPSAVPTEPAPDGASVTCPPATVSVHTADELTAALGDVRPGASIELVDGVYEGRFVANLSGTAEQPIFLCGGPGAILDGGGTRKGYALHLAPAAYWRVVGFTVRNAQKGVMADGTSHTVIQGLTVSDIGDEGIHLRTASTDTLVAGNTITRTGLRKPKFGEGIYVGSAKSNWCRHTRCQPDRSDRNILRGNVITATTSESIDIKEGTTGGQVIGNTFDGSAIAAADSWVDVKGNNWVIEGNRGRVSPEDGFQTHEILDGWGTGNVFRANTAQVNGPGHGFNLVPALRNVVTCDNEASGAARGLTNTTCTR